MGRDTRSPDRRSRVRRLLDHFWEDCQYLGMAYAMSYGHLLETAHGRDGERPGTDLGAPEDMMPAADPRRSPSYGPVPDVPLSPAERQSWADLEGRAL